MEAQRELFDLKQGRDELNLAEFPLFYLGQRVPADLKSLDYEDEIFDQGKNVAINRKLTISASKLYGLPTVRDADVLHALLLIAKQTTDFSNPVVTFSRYQLAKVLGWNDSGRSYKRIQDALFKWLGVNLEFQQSWWAKEEQQWQTKGFHLVESVTINDCSRRRGQAELPLSSCRFSDEFFASLTTGYIKSLNLEDYFHLTIPAAKQAYRFLDKRFYRKSRIDFDLHAFACEHVGLSRKYKPCMLKKRIEPAIRELEAIGFIKPEPPSRRYTNHGRGQYTIHFQRGNSENTFALPGNKQERSVKRQLLKELTERGVTAKVAREIIEDKAIGEKRIRQKIELVDWLKSQDPDCLKRGGGFLTSAIRNDYALPEGFETKAQREAKSAKVKGIVAARARAEEKKAQEQAQKQQEEQARVDEYLAALTPEKREQVIDAAIANDPGLLREQYQNKKGILSEAAYSIMIKNQVNQLLEAETDMVSFR